MKKLLKSFAAFVCSAACAFSFAACGSDNNQSGAVNEPPVNIFPAPSVPEPPDVGENNQPEKPAVTVKGESSLLGAPASTENKFEYDRAGYDLFISKVENFAASFAYNAFENCENNKNFTVSPISVFMALGLIAECAGEDARTEILSVLDVTYEELLEYYPVLFGSLNHEATQRNPSVISVTNSIWLDENIQAKQNCLDNLSEKYYSWSYSADFANKNAEANQAIRDFIKQQTHGLIDRDFELTEYTIFALINTLYLKTAWNYGGEDLPFTPAEYSFKNSDGSTTVKKLLSGAYQSGKAYIEDKFSSFMIEAVDGYKLKFIKPNDGYGVKDVFTAENIIKVNNEKFDGFKYKTSCIFPEFEAEYSDSIVDLFKVKYGITEIFKFSDYTFFPLIGKFKSACTEIKHVTTLKVNKTGIEGAAVTVGAGEGVGAPDNIVFENFVVDRAFGFIITDSNDVTLFSGVVNKI